MKVLVVDDCLESTGKLCKLLTKNGYQVIEAHDGEDAIRKANEHIPDLVLMDIVMPGVNGFQATRTISRTPETKEIPIIMVSAKDQEVDRNWSEKQGASAYLCKPVDEKLLIETIQKVSN